MTANYAYDALGRLTQTTSPSGSSNQITQVYDRLGRVTAVTDISGRTTSFTYDFKGRRLTQTDAVGTVTNTYDIMGNLLSVMDELGHVTSYEYNNAMQLTATMDAASKAVINQYDSYGRLTKSGAGLLMTDPTEFVYSATTGQLTRTRYKTGATYYDVDYLYDGLGRMTRANDWLGGDGMQYAYDAAGQLTSIREYTAAKTLAYTYDDAGRIASMSDHLNKVTNYTYTDIGNLATLTTPGGSVWQWQYNALGQPTQYTHPNGTRTEYGYDTRHRMTSIVHRNLTNNAVMDSYALTLTDGGDITRVTHADGAKWDYTYDNRGRLETALRKNSANTVLDSYGYTYDAGDNMTQQVRTGGANNTWVYAYNAANEQTGMTLNGGTPETRTYDAWGRLATRTQGTYAATYGYRYGGKMYSLASNFPGEANVTLEYRGDGRLRQRTQGAATTTYHYDRGWNPILELSSTGAVMYASVYRPGTTRGELLATFYGNPLGVGSLLCAYHDQLGSVRRLRLNKTAWETSEFEPYGKIYATTNSMSLPTVFALHPFDAGIQAYRAPYRMYSPSMARWTTEDPLGMVDGPNMYAYVAGEPTGGADKLGLAKGTKQRCNYLWNKMKNYQEELRKRIKEYIDNKKDLEWSDSDDDVPMHKSRRKHWLKIEEYRDKLNKTKQEFIDKCYDDDGKPKYPMPTEVPLPPIRVPGPPVSSLQNGCPVEWTETLFVFGY